MHSEMDATALPLAGLIVAEFCNVAAGPFCGMLLADMGADVIKIEPPGGDMLRAWPPHTDGFSENFASLNRGKRSIALDLKIPTDRDIAFAIMRKADVVLENNRPGAMERLGLGWRRIHAENPKLIYCSISAYGQTGPRAGEGGFDVTMQAASGVMSVTGAPGGAPVKCGVPVADFTAGLYGAFAIAAAVARVRDGGEGVHIDVPMLGTTLAIGALQTSEYFGTGKDPQALGSAHPRNAPYQAYPARDRYFVIAAGNDKLWASVCEIIARPELVADPRFVSVRARAKNQIELAEILSAIFVTHDTADWLSAFERAGVPASLINTYSESVVDPQVQAAGWVQPLTLPGGAVTRTFASPLAMDGKRAPIRKAPPRLDEDRAAILAMIGQKDRAG
ncbi:MAG TPA: CoA transferase [Micropepsaceae bacterium]|nr:CoA transferase [Micropepsaceae bacterium]